MGKSGTSSLNYDIIEKGIAVSMDAAASFYPAVRFTCPSWIATVAIILQTEAVILVVPFPSRNAAGGPVPAFK